MPEENKAQTLINVESMINSSNSRLDVLVKEFREKKGMLSGVLESADDFQKLEEEYKKQAKIKTIAKQKILASPSTAKIVEDIKDLQLQIKELKTALSDYLSQFVILSGTNQIEGPDGVLRQIIYSAKLVKSKS